MQKSSQFAPLVTQPTWRQLLDDARRRLDEHDARRILERASGWDGASLIVHLDDRATDRATVHVERMVERRAVGEPLQYVLGAWGFRTLDLLVDRRVLIPRPETEQVVDVALGELARLGLGGRPPVAVDLGTGSGAIALSLAVEAGAEVWATDVSPDALAVARANLAGVGGPAATRVRMHEGDWYDALPGELAGRVDLVISNPPYVAADEPLPDEVAAWEPHGALVPGPTGMEAIERVVAGALQWLASPGVLVVELAPHQADLAASLALDAGFPDVDVRPDLAGRLRALVARR